MYIWKIDKLNEELVAGNMPEREVFKYLVASSILYALAMIQYSNPNSIDTWSGVAAGLVTLIGLFFIYKCNGGDNGKDFLIRYLSISWVVFVRMFVLLMIPTMVFVFTLQEIYMGGIPDETTNIDLIYMTAIEIAFVLWVAKHVNSVARASNA
tara:strand:+ start:180 stop:638 length:459 start_codon:yes stop_codon:yes gene_type:complete